MARQAGPEHLRHHDRPSSPAFSRLMVLGYLIAMAIGVLIGLAWMAYRLMAGWF
jgi:hypothetical protein